MGEHYNQVLKETKDAAIGIAEVRVPELYWILRKEEKKTPDDARAILEHDLIETWSLPYIQRYIPQEAKNVVKAEAGKKGAQATNLVLAQGPSVTIEADATNAAKSSEKPESRKDLINLRKKIEEQSKHITNLAAKLEGSERENDGLRVLISTNKTITETKKFQELRGELEAAESEVKYLKGEMNAEMIIELLPQNYPKLKNILASAMRDKLPSIKFQLMGKRVVEIFTI